MRPVVCSLGSLALVLSFVACDGKGVANPRGTATRMAPPNTRSASLTGPTTQPIVGSLSSRLAPTQCMAVGAADQTPGALLVLETCSGGTNQQFTWSPDGSISVFGATRCVDGYGDGVVDGTAIDSWPCNGGSNQLWHPTAAGEIQGVESNKCIVVQNASATTGARLVLGPCQATAVSQWDNSAAPPPPPPPPPPATGATFSSRLAPSQCMTVRSASQTPGALLVLGSCSGVASQLFTWSADGSIKVFGGTRCLDAYGDGVVNGTLIDSWTCNGGANQLWRPTAAGEIQGVGSNRCIVVLNGGVTAGTRLVLGLCRATPVSQWDSGTAATQSVASVTVSPGTAIVNIGQTVQLTATLKDAAGNVLTGRPIAWSSSNTAVATTSTTGFVTALAAGNATITALSEGKTGTTAVTVPVVPPPPAPVATVSVSPFTASVSVGQAVQLTATLTDAAGTVLTGRAIAWSSSNTAVATTSTTGLVTALAVGNATITALSEGKTGTASVTVPVVPPVPVASVAVTPSTPTVSVGRTVQLTAVTKDASGTVLTGRTITWSSSNTAVATTSATGLVTAIAAGTATITALSEGKTGTAAVTVPVVPPPPAPVATVSVTPSTASLSVGQTAQLAAVTKDASGTVLTGRAITWSSSNTSVATTGASGMVTAVAVGSATITALSEGKSGTAAVAVTAGGGVATNECASWKTGWIWCDDFETDRTGQYFEYDNGGGKFVRTAGTGVNGSTAMRAVYTAGDLSNSALHLAFGQTPDNGSFRPVDAGTANYREIYWRVFTKREAPWVGMGPNKFTRAISFARPDWSEAMIAHVWSSVTDPYESLDPASGTDAAGNLMTVGYNDFPNLRWLGGMNTDIPVDDQAHTGLWLCFEVHVRLNDAGQANGVMELWVDGHLSAQRTGLNWVGSYNAFGINAIFLENYWNGGAPAADVREMDNFVVSTQRIGCGP